MNRREAASLCGHPPDVYLTGNWTESASLSRVAAAHEAVRIQLTAATRLSYEPQRICFVPEEAANHRWAMSCFALSRTEWQGRHFGA